ncbi:MAG TPA: tetratricopeptide repeat protein [Candidatus Limnocylindrales bacterium]|nr:tetratricopeptide repeat protein [Candidatus Limnocylindrales bacterium]
MKHRAPRARWWFWLGSLLVLANGFPLVGADLKEAEEKFFSGDFTNSIVLAQQALKEGENREEWVLLLTRALLTTGRYPEARTIITNALEQRRRNVRLSWQAREVFFANGQPEKAKEMLENIGWVVGRRPSDFSEAPDLVISGKAALQLGADPKKVLDRVFDAAAKSDPKLRDVYLASGELALDKHDYALAAKKFQEGLAQIPDDPDLYFGLAQAYAPNETALMVKSAEAALKRNSNHVGSLLLLADHTIDAEDYSEAEKLLDRVQAINPWHAEAWAYRAVLAHLQNQPDREESSRQIALKFWATNPRVDYLIGLKLSQNYRFAEAAAHQRQALQFAPDYLPAKAQLAEDLLRLGEETDGWRLVEEVQKQDAYDVEAYNLATLHDVMGKFATLTNENFVLRMNSHEAAVYGPAVLALLESARSNLCAKYGFEPKRPTIVEVFHEQKDFAVRTFGMPGNPGYLGVCFGTVITANSPAAHFEHPVNWQAVLWHEFCHVLTLQMTRNKMPRWLSEGISVYEEAQANPAWGQRMNPQYRAMVLGDNLTPVSDLSGAFLAPPSPQHLQFAYYESSLVVEFLVQRFGLSQLKAILADLGEGTEINRAIEKQTAPIETIEKDFAAYAKERAETLAPGLDFEKPKFEVSSSAKSSSEVATNIDETLLKKRLSRSRGAGALSDKAVTEWIDSHPTNFYALNELARRFIERKDFRSAKAPLEKLVELYPGETGVDSGSAMLAGVYRELGETNAERQIQSRVAMEDDEALPAYQRLMELAAAGGEWEEVERSARRYLAVNPLVELPYRFLAQAAEHRQETRIGIEAYRALLALEPSDPAEVHYQLARLLYRSGDRQARRHLLQALEEAPRYRAALDLLLQMNGESPQAKADTRASDEVKR